MQGDVSHSEVLNEVVREVAHGEELLLLHADHARVRLLANLLGELSFRWQVEPPPSQKSAR